MKRGISALISTVLIVALVIVIFLVISNFIGRSVEEATSGAEGRVERTLSCSGLNFRVTNVCVDAPNSATTVQMNVDNIGDDVEDLFIRVLNDAGAVGVVEFDGAAPVVAPNRIVAATTINTLSVAVANPTRVEIYGRNSDGDSCNDNLQIVTQIGTC
jgi:archaellum component FlaF (FlaF/FlaG flagellin family)